jgi:hypothetical protein
MRLQVCFSLGPLPSFLFFLLFLLAFCIHPFSEEGPVAARMAWWYMWTHFTDSVPRSSALNMFAYESWTTKQL